MNALPNSAVPHQLYRHFNVTPLLAAVGLMLSCCPAVAQPAAAPPTAADSVVEATTSAAAVAAPAGSATPLATAASTSITTAAASATAPADLPTIVTIANRVPVPGQRVTAAVTVLEAADLAAYGKLNLNDILRQSVGVGTSGHGGLGATTTLRIRGEEGFRTRVIFDGLELSDASAPQVLAPFEHILAASIDRVEILRGPQGLGYGADAGRGYSVKFTPRESHRKQSRCVPASPRPAECPGW